LKYIVAHRADWPAKFEAIRNAIAPFLPDTFSIIHIGSTSIPGMPAKDIIDLDVVCPQGVIGAAVAALINAGYHHEGDKGLTGREAFSPEPGSPAAALPAHHLYACEAGASELHKHLAFKGYLLCHPERRLWLAEQKVAADRAAESRDDYIERKDAPYRIITCEALEWAKLNPASLL
jgi:GrpB-like predicted nucleotidyltransferase (UPF0157 family)